MAEVQHVEQRELRFASTSGWPLGGTLFMGAGDGPAVLISPATAVPHTYYKHFASWLVEQGASAVLAYDYSGVGASAGGSTKGIGYRQWAMEDFPAAFAALAEAVPGREIVGVGHSFGGHALGLSGVANGFARYMTMGTLSGYWRDVGTPVSVWFQASVLLPGIAHAFQRIPRALSPGEPLPKGVALDWGRWMRLPDYFFSDPALPETARFDDVTIPILSIGATDDAWGSVKAVEGFMAHYTCADVRQVWLEPGKSGPIKHLGLFRRAHREVHWDVMGDFVLRGEWPEGARVL